MRRARRSAPEAEEEHAEAERRPHRRGHGPPGPARLRALSLYPGSHRRQQDTDKGADKPGGDQWTRHLTDGDGVGNWQDGTAGRYGSHYRHRSGSETRVEEDPSHAPYAS